MTKRDANESDTELQTLWVKKSENDLDTEISFWPNSIYECVHVWWPRGLSMVQLSKTHANETKHKKINLNWFKKTHIQSI